MNLFVFVRYCEQRAVAARCRVALSDLARAGIPLTLVQTAVYWLFLCGDTGEEKSPVTVALTVIFHQPHSLLLRLPPCNPS